MEATDFDLKWEILTLTHQFSDISKCGILRGAGVPERGRGHYHPHEGEQRGGMSTHPVLRVFRATVASNSHSSPVRQGQLTHSTDGETKAGRLSILSVSLSAFHNEMGPWR